MLISYKCNLCDNSIDKIINDPKDIVGVMSCGACGGFLERQLSGPSNSNFEKIDPGNLTKPVLFNAERHKMSYDHGNDLVRKAKEKEKLNEEKN